MNLIRKIYNCRWIPFNIRWKVCHEWVDAVNAFKARLHSVFTVKQLHSFPAGENPFWHDSYHTGVYLGRDLLVMNSLGLQEPVKDGYIILVHIPTGQRIKVSFPETKICCDCRKVLPADLQTGMSGPMMCHECAEIYARECLIAALLLRDGGQNVIV